jgi:hypothetical protein
MAFCDKETRTRQQAEEVIRQVGVPFSRTFIDLSLSAEERERTEEPARYEAECRELEAYRQMGPLEG